SCVNIAEHLAAKKIYYDLSGWRRLDVELADRRTWIDDYNRQPASGPLSHFFFSEKLAAFVVPDHVFDSNGRFFVCRRAVVIQAETTDGACVDDAFDPFVKRRLHYVVRAFDVVLIHLVGVFAPEAIISGAMIDNASASDGLPE